MKTRHFLLAALLLILGQNVRAQMIVSDPENTKQAIMSLAQLKNTIVELKEQKARLDAGLDMVRKVNHVIKDCETIKEILSRQSDLNKRCLDLCSGKHTLNIRNARKLNSSVRQLIENNGRLLRLAKKVTSNSVNMNDAERLKQLQDVEEQIKKDEKSLARIDMLLNGVERMKRMVK
uniref:hypothetical protein n=1 Tax=Phocaeicola sp. TaxID=2773926 RepID=UPI003FEE560F